MEQSDKNDDDTDNDDPGFDCNESREDIDTDEFYESFDENEGRNDDEEYTGPILAGGHRFDRKLLCVKYPGVVNNPEKAIETLGGLGTISATFDTPNRRMELRFRAEDGYCKPTCGERQEKAGFLIRVRVKKSRVEQMEKTEREFQEDLNFKGPYDLEKLEKLFGALGRGVNSVETEKKKEVQSETEKGEESPMEISEGPLGESTKKEEKNSSENNQTETEAQIQPENLENPDESQRKNGAEVASDNVEKNRDDSSKDENYPVPNSKVVGRVETEFNFQNLCDFQFLAIGKSVLDPKIEEDIYDSIYPIGIPPYRWLQNKVPFFLPPPAFSRMDTVQQFSLKTERDKGPRDVIGKTRKHRGGFTNFINFNSPETPCEPPHGIEVAMKVRCLKKSHLERIKQIFEERPIWSKNALMTVTDFTGEQLKVLLLCVAYYFMTGPWRIMWVRLGYDPRKDPRSRMYQTLDYRLRAMRGLEFTVSRKRPLSEYTLPYKCTPGMKPRTTILKGMQEEGTSEKKDQLSNEDAYVYREGVIPPSRQIFYQYCDIHVPEIQEMLAKLPDHLPPDAKCHEKRGWLPIGFGDQCREIINRQVRAVLRKQMNIPEDLPTALPPKRPTKNSFRVSRLTARELAKNRRKKKRKQSPDEREPV